MKSILPLLLFTSFLLAKTQTVAISYFDNTSGLEEFNPLSKGLADMLITDLSNVKSIQIVEREKLESLLKEIDLGESKFMDESTAQKLGKGLGAGYMLTGSYLIMGETMRIDARLVDVATGEVSMGEEITGEKNTFFELEKELVEKLITALNLSLSKSEKRRVKKVQTESFDSFNAYSSALEALDNGNLEKSQEYLSKAVEIDDGFDIAWDKLDEIIELLDQLEQSRGTGLTIHLVEQIDRLAGLNSGECNEFAALYQNLVNSVSEYSGSSLRIGEWQDTTVLISNWKDYLLPNQPKSYDESIIMLSQKAYEAQQILELLLSKSYSNKACGMYGNPNNVAMSFFVGMLQDLYDYYSANYLYSPKINIVNYEGEVVAYAKDFPKIIVKYGTRLKKEFPLTAFYSNNEYLKRMIRLLQLNQGNSSAEIITALKLSGVTIDINDFIIEKHLWIDALDITVDDPYSFYKVDPKSVQKNYETIFRSFLFDSAPKSQLNVGLSKPRHKEHKDYPSVSEIYSYRVTEHQIYFIPESVTEFQNIEVLKLSLVAHSIPSWFYKFENLKILDLSTQWKPRDGAAINAIYQDNNFYIKTIPAIVRKNYDDAVTSGNIEEIEYLEYELGKWNEFKYNFKDCPFETSSRFDFNSCNIKPKADSVKSDIKLLKNLELIDLTNNNIKYIDDNIKLLKKLKYLVLTGNPIINDLEKMAKLKKILPTTSIITSTSKSFWASSNPWDRDEGNTYMTKATCEDSYNREYACEYIEGDNEKDLILFNYFKERIINNLSDEYKGYYNNWQEERKNYYSNMETKKIERIADEEERIRKEKERIEKEKEEREKEQQRLIQKAKEEKYTINTNTKVYDIPVGDSFTIGPDDARVTIIHWSDFQ